MDNLSERKEKILRAVIVEYVTGAEPIPSELIAQKYELGVRSATVRNELSEMSDLGFLEQPHTSAGRIPSDLGYRYFVDRLLIGQPLDKERKRKVDQATDEEDTLRELLKHTTTALSRLTHLLSAAATLRDGEVRVRNVILTVIGKGKALLILVLQNGLVENRIMKCPDSLTIDQVGRINETLSGEVEGRTLRNLVQKRTLKTGDLPTDAILHVITNEILNIARELTKGQVIIEGAEYIVSQPEFQRDGELLERLIRNLEDETAIHEALLAPSDTFPTITIGKEHKDHKMQTLSVVRQTFHVGNEEAGTIAIIGPTRMNYEHGIRLLDYTCVAISQTLTTLLN